MCCSYCNSGANRKKQKQYITIVKLIVGLTFEAQLHRARDLLGLRRFISTIQRLPCLFSSWPEHKEPPQLLEDSRVANGVRAIDAPVISIAIEAAPRRRLFHVMATSFAGGVEPPTVVIRAKTVACRDPETVKHDHGAAIDPTFFELEAAFSVLIRFRGHWGCFFFFLRWYIVSSVC